MSERREDERTRESPQDELRKKLLDGRLSGKEFLEHVFNLDQSTPGRDQAEKNIQLLLHPEVATKLQENDELYFELNNLLSLSHFHVGQKNLLGGRDAHEDLKKALETAEKIQEDGYEQWQYYIRATLAYLENDLPKLESLEQQITDANKGVVQRLIQGLRTRGEIDYRADYQGTSHNNI